MDNLTHSLAGAVLGQMGLKQRTGLAMPALVIGANLPDIDAVCAVIGTQSLAMRRGLTHGPIALVVLPLILTALLLAYGRWRPNPTRLPIHGGWLLALAYIGALSHPALDWLNSYGIRFLEPFSSQWFAGDTLFIIDVWIWTALALGVWLSQRRERRAQPNWQTPAVASFAVVCAYIFGNGLITSRAESVWVQKAINKQCLTLSGPYSPDEIIDNIEPPCGQVLLVANPVPIVFWQRELLWQSNRYYGRGTYSVTSGAKIDPGFALTGLDRLEVSVARLRDPDARAFLFWSRMPLARIDGKDLVLSDQRFGNPLTANTFAVRVPLDSLKP